MKVRNFVGAIAVSGLALAPQAAMAQTAATAATAPKVDDGMLKTRIESRLKSSDSLKESDINVAVENGVVTLTGTVHSEAQSLRARTLAKVDGVTNVENKLTVDSKTTRAIEKAGDKTGKALDKAADKTGEAAEKTASAAQKAGAKTEHETVKAAKATGTAGKSVGEKTKDAAMDVGGNVNDGLITTKLKADFVNEDSLKGSSINADTNNHIVTLKGTVTTEAGRARAIEIAKTTKGVSRVVDELTIAPAK